MLPLFDESTPAAPPPLTDVAAAFEDFWSEWPRKTGKIAAEKKFYKALKTATVSRIMTGLRWQKHLPQWQKTVKGIHLFVPHPATWLHQGRYDDPMPPGFHIPQPEQARRVVEISPARRVEMMELRAHVDHQNHLQTIDSAEAYYRAKPYVPRSPVPPCPCWKCAQGRES